jgi:threonine/homoserine/homoserine lactone efflux protein
MIEALLKGITIGLVLSISVGPALFSVIKHSLNNGPKGGVAFAAGISASDITIVLIANVFTELFHSISSFEKQIGVAGSIFLISMGIFFLFFKKVKVNEAGKQVFMHRKRDLLKISLSGYFMNLLNPGAIILWITITTSLIMYPVRYKIITYTTCLLVVLLGDLAKVLLAGKIRNRLTPHNIHIINRINGILLIIFGLVLIWGILFYTHKPV